MAKKRNKICQLFGERIRKLRKERGFSQEDFANEVGIHRTYIGSIERGEKNPCLNNIQRMSHALKISLRELFTF